MLWLACLLAATCLAAGGLAAVARAVKETAGRTRASIPPPQLILLARGAFAAAPLVALAAEWYGVESADLFAKLLLCAAAFLVLGAGTSGYCMTVTAAARLVDLAHPRGEAGGRR